MTEGLWPLPKSWQWRPFYDVARVAADLVDPGKFGDWRHVAPNHIESGTGRLLPTRTVQEDGVTSPKHRFDAGQILYTKIRPYLAKVVIPGYAGLCSADMYPLTTSLESRYLKWWLLHPAFTRAVAGDQARTILPKINKQALYRLPVPVPPLDEQQRIVAVLEDHLSRLDAAEAGLISASKRVALLQRPRAETDDWICLGEVLLHARYGTSTKCSYDGAGLPVVRIPNVASGRVDVKDLKRAQDQSVDLTPFLLAQDDVLVIRSNGSVGLVGRMAVVPKQTEPRAYASYLIRLTVDTQRLQPAWLQYVSGLTSVRHQIEAAAASSAGQHNLNLSTLRALRIPLPPLRFQESLLAEVRETEDDLSRFLDSVEAGQRRTFLLRRALLHAAFSGFL